MKVEAKERFIKANGLEHHVLIWGEGEPEILLCHGFLDIAWSFDLLAQELVRAGRTVVAFDWRGHGQSEWIGRGGYYHFPDYVLDLDELLPQLSTQPIHLFGHSMGSVVCVLFAACRKERLRSLTLVEGLGPPEQNLGMNVARLRGWLDGVAKRREKKPRVMRDADEALTRMRVMNPVLSDEFGRWLAQKATRPSEDEEGIVWSFDPLHQTTAPRPFRAEVFADMLASISTPVLLVMGEKGFRLADESERRAQLGDHEFVEIPDATHMIHWFHPQELAAQIEAFVSRSEATE